MFGALSIKESDRSIERIGNSLLHAMQQGFDHPNAIHLSSDKRALIGYAFPQHYNAIRWPLYSEAYNSYVLLFGELFLNDGRSLAANTVDHVLKGLQQKGAQYLLECDGAYLLVVMDENETTIRIYNDPFGNFAVHYIKRDDVIVFSTQSSSILPALSEVQAFDERGLLQYISLGQTAGGTTLYQGVTRLEAGHWLLIDANGAHTDQYYSTTYKETGDTQYLLEECYESFRDSVALRLSRPHTATALSGGFDSRVTWSIIDALKLNDHTTAYTHGLPQSTDIKIARKIAAVLHASHHEYIFDDDLINSLPKYWERTVLQSDGAAGIDSAIVYRAWEEQAKHFKIVLDSHGGPIYRRQILKGRETVQSNGGESAATFLLQMLGSPLRTSPVLKKELREKAIAEGLQTIHRFLEKNRSTTLGDTIDQYYLQVMSAERYAQTANMQMNFIGLSHPLLTPKAFDLVQKLSIRERRKNAVHRYVIHRASPVLERIPLDNSGAMVSYRGFELFRYMPAVWEKIIGKASRWIPNIRRLSMRSPAYSIIPVLYSAEEIVRSLLLDQGSVHSLTEAQEMKNLVDQSYNGNLSRMNELVQLLSWSILIRAKQKV